jgi:chemotaxis protein CheX
MTTPEEAQITTKLPMTWRPLMCLAAQEVFEMMASTKLTVCAEPEKMNYSEFTAVVGLAGPITGIFTIRCTGRAAQIIASRMLGIPLHEAGVEMFDALGEICNMVAGNFKAKLGDAGMASMLSVPTVIKGSDYKLRSLANGAVVESAQQFDNELILFKVNCQTSKAFHVDKEKALPSCEVSINCKREQISGQMQSCAS